MRKLRAYYERFQGWLATPQARAALFVVLGLFVATHAGAALAEPLGGTTADFQNYAKNTTNQTAILIDIFNYIAFLSGCILAGLGINELRLVSEGSGSDGLKMRHPIAKLGFGGILMAVPYMTAVAQGTFDGGTSAIFEMFNMNAYKFNPSGTGGIKNNGISGLIAHGVNETMILIDVANVAAFIIGVFFVVRGIQMLRAHIENPGQTQLPDSLKRLAVGGALLSFPIIVNVIYNTFGAGGTGSSALANTGWTANAGSGAGSLDGMMVSFISDIANPAYSAIELFCYLAGILMVLFAMQRLVRTAQDGPRGPLGFGTITMFVVAGCLLSFPQLLSALDMSLLGGGQALTKVEFMSGTGVDAAQLQNAKNVFSAVLAFMAVIGFLSVVRGLFLLKGFAEGAQGASMMSVVTHIVAGSIAINLGSFINAVQTSLGITSFPVTFN
ncbi:MAG: hypothetical protein H6865_02780 [Rhodospirillales bacterium]|nr:hypothetical protein [Alphaproteobacteria bacterium]MCB9986541.1 hypothetical protein [Rhodospirillales bacterium]USO06923.1 MAG: hypothetical protein H6866_05605 [Rhodospirillales bacterium]